MTVKTRFAPSPTGFLHIGGARTALFAWLYARHHQGQFVLRIEDTDTERSTQASTQAILDGMQWLGLDYDEGPYYQSQRLSQYQAAILQLVDTQQAYYCTCSKARLETLREQQMASKQKPRYDGYCRNLGLTPGDEPYVIRFKNPLAGAVRFNDAVYGEITVSNSELDDLIIQRSDGMPTYNLTVVVDDADMEITHVVRGDDHINNTPRQINLLKALGLSIPDYAHLPMILGPDGKRLSKRHGAVSVLQYREDGFLPEALLNYLVRLGWSHGDMEIFSQKDMQQLFSLNAVNKGASSINLEKLSWLNQHYQKSLPAETVAARLAPILKDKGIDYHTGPDLSAVVTALAERSHTLVEMADLAKVFFTQAITHPKDLCEKHLKPALKTPLQALADALANLEGWTPANIHLAITQTAEANGLKFGKLASPLRFCITGGGQTPSIDTTTYLIGKTAVISRLDQAIELIP